MTARYVYGARYIDEPVLMYRDGDADGNFTDTDEVLYYLQDRLYNVVALTDVNGTVRESICYAPYGRSTNLRESDSNEQVASHFGNPYLFTGRRLDDKTCFYHYRNRYYSAALGRFISRDPIGYDAGDANLYRYVGNNPTNAADPMGNEASMSPNGMSACVQMVSYLIPWDPSKCPTTCKQWYGKYGKYINAIFSQKVYDLMKGNNENVVVVFRNNCGGSRRFNLTCDCKSFYEEDSDAPTIVCIKPKGICKSFEILEHEMVHVRQIANGKPIDELEAYRKSCEVRAQQQCLKSKRKWNDAQLKEWIETCARGEVGRSLGGPNREEIIGSCSELCKEWRIAKIREKRMKGKVEGCPMPPLEYIDP